MARPLRIQFPGALYHVMSRSNDAGRAVAAYLTRRVFGYPATDTAAVVGYRDHSGVGRAIRRVEQGSNKLQQTVRLLQKGLLNP